MISDKLIEEYRELYRKHYGINLSKERAVQEGLCLLNLAKTVTKYAQRKENIGIGSSMDL